jgi:excisionase family DNA binding protein
MENAIILHNLSPLELEMLIKKIVEEVLNNAPIDNPYELLTREEACSLLKINKTSLWKWTKKGKIIAYGIGTRVLYKKSELMESLTRIN